ELAGCDFDHYVLDQGSRDLTPDWLTEVYEPEFVAVSPQNIGLSRGHNYLLDHLDGEYDVVVTFDNDCEVVQDGTLRVCAEVASHGDWVVSPTVLGLKHPPQTGAPVQVHGVTILPYQEMGGIFRAMPGSFARVFRF